MAAVRTDAAYISRRPAWADRVTIGAEAIDYAWTAPTVPQNIERDGELCSAPVDITREDLLYVNDEGVVLDQGPERIFLLDTNLDVENARRLAAGHPRVLRPGRAGGSSRSDPFSESTSTCTSWSRPGIQGSQGLDNLEANRTAADQ